MAAVVLAPPGRSAAQEVAASTVAEPAASPAAEPDGPVRHYLLGASLSSSQGHLGQQGRSLGLHPVWGFWAGRYRLSGGGASALWSVGRETVVDTGLSTTLLGQSDWSLGAALSWGGGRKPDNDPLLAGVPELRPTLRGKLSVGYAFAPRWSLGLGASHDLLNRAGGGQYSASLNYREPVSPATYWDASLGASWGNATYMQSHYGIPASAAPRPAYHLAGGVEGIRLGWSITSALSFDWVAFGGVSLSRLLGGVGRSPLVGERQVWSANAGIAYRR